MKQLKDCRVTDVALEARMGAARDDAIREAMVLAIEDCVKVVLTFNNDEYVIDPLALFELVHNPKK